MKSYIKKLLRESLGGNFGYRAGDLKIKAEKKGLMVSNYRDTGHFGTGFYFFGDKESAIKHDESTGRGISVIDLSKYNLIKGDLALHEDLKKINHAYVSNDIRGLYYGVKGKLIEYGKLKPISDKFKHIRGFSDEDKLTDDEHIEFNTELEHNIGVDRHNDKVINDVINRMHSENVDSPSTVLMKYLGFDGVDVRGTDLDNGIYGSLVYDIK
jgi:hypothetical protein